MVIQSGVLELDVMDLKPTWRDIPRLKQVTFDMLGKKAREAFAATGGVAYFNSIPGGWVGRMQVIADVRAEAIAIEDNFCIDEIQEEAA